MISPQTLPLSFSYSVHLGSSFHFMRTGNLKEPLPVEGRIAGIATELKNLTETMFIPPFCFASDTKLL
jgi:hypothetical protein